jgi:putative Ca2+/H+ antiporter (TMEM165/GDT1 family)
VSRSKVWFFTVCGVGTAYAAIVVYASFNGGAVLPHAAENMVRAILTAAFVVTALWCLIGEAEQRVVDQLEARIAQRLRHPVYADDSTNEIPRIVIPRQSGQATVYKAAVSPPQPANNVVALPSAETVSAVQRLARKVIGPQ